MPQLGQYKWMLDNVAFLYPTAESARELTSADIERYEIGPGDDVFMIGRFVDHDGSQTNVPAMRFGHISIIGAPVRQPTGYGGTSTILDMNSRTGFSGSPVFVYRTHGSIFAAPNTIVSGGHLLKLLGIHWGQFPERWELRNGAGAAATGANDTLRVDGSYVHGLSGMTCAAPASDILRVLNSPSLVAQRTAVEAIARPRS